MTDTTTLITINAGVEFTVTSCHLVIISIIIIIAGITGGVVNFFMNNTTKEIDGYEMAKSIMFGIVASAIVPLLLQMMSSDLLESSQTNSLKYFVFGGFCLVAAVYSTKFIQSIADKIIKDLNAVKQVAENNKTKVDLLINKSSDAEAKPIGLMTKDVNFSADKTDVDKIMGALSSTKFKFRTLDGVVTETQLTSKDVNSILKELEEKNVVMKISTKDKTLWTLKD
jgi:hypothetical protein